MESIERLWVNGDIDSTLRELEIYLSSAKGRDQPSNNDPLLLAAYINYMLGRIKESMKYLQQAQFPTFDIQQWIVENNKLVIQFLENGVFPARVSNEGNVVAVRKLETLLEKVQGLPSANVALLELHFTLNYGLVMFLTNASENVIPGGYESAQSKISNTIQRVLGFNSESHLSVLETLRLLSGADTDQINPVLDNIFYPFSWLCWLLSLFWLLNFKVKEAQELIQFIQKLLHTKQYCCNLRKTGYIFSLIKYDHDTSSLLSSSCHLLSAYCSIFNHDRKQALKETEKSLETKTDLLPALLIKGWLLYENSHYTEALSPLQQLVEQSNDTHYKSTAYNILGCASAKLGKHHTAMVKFHTSSVCSYHNIKPIHNVCTVYHELKKFDLEIELQKKILSLLQSKPVNDMSNLVTCDSLSVSFIIGVASKILDSVIHKDRFIISLDVYGLKDNDCMIEHPLLTYHGTLYSLAHNCLQLKRYNDAVMYFLDLLALMEKTTGVEKIGLPSLLVVYHETAEALFHCERYEDTLTICDKASQQHRAHGIPPSFTAQKRLPENTNAYWCDIKTMAGILSCKADALIKLSRYVDAYQCYERVFELLKNASGIINPREDDGMIVSEQDQKRQKTEKGQKGISRKISGEYIREFEHLQAQILNKQGLLVKSLGRHKEALHLFTRSIACEPDQLRYHYEHTSLLLEMGRTEEARKNWSKIRNLDNGNVNTSKTDDHQENDMNTLYCQMDKRVLQDASKR